MSVLAVFAACSGPTSPIICPDERPLAIVAIISDSASDESVVGATGMVRHEDYVESMYGTGSDLWADGNGPGLYDVEIEHQDYQTWRDEEVLVEDGGECYEVKTTEIEVRLQPV